MPIKKVKQSIVRCRECGASSQEAFLEKIKGTDEYICDDCVSDIDTGSYKKVVTTTITTMMMTIALVAAMSIQTMEVLMMTMTTIKR